MLGSDDYEFMERAIDGAERSELADEAAPKVGAVVAKEGELVGEAHRGQTGEGHHTEFALLQRVLKSTDLTEGATLYTTLEPCTHRSHNKRPCAEWVVCKGIHRVVIGILDPNPSICGRGYWYLVDKGIEVDFFPAALARRILVQNHRFIQSQRGGVHPTPALATLIAEHKSAIISPYAGLGWWDTLSLQDCPNL